MQFMTIKGKKYILKRTKHKDGDWEMKLIPYDEQEYNKIVDAIVEKISKVVDKRVMVKQLLAHIEYDQILKFHKNLTGGVKPVAKKGCYEIKIGKDSLMLVE